MSSLAQWWEGERGLAFRQRWQARWHRAIVLEGLAGALIVTFWALIAVIGAPILIIVPWLAACLFLHASAVETGRRALQWVATGFLLALVAGNLAAGAFGGTSGAASYTVGAVTGLIYHELLQVSFARRRSSHVEEQVYVASAAGLGVVALVAIAGIVIAEPLSTSTAERSWLWVPAITLALVVVAVAMLVVPGRRSPPASRRRWQPGERIPPPPITQLGAGGPGPVSTTRLPGLDPSSEPLARRTRRSDEPQGPGATRT